MKDSSNELPLAENIKFLRYKTLKKKGQYSEELLKKPVSYWIKEDRLLNEMGKEFTIILRTKGCSWALGEMGGCSMCGYIQDANINSVKPELILSQFDYAFNDKLKEIEKDNNNYILKIFNSGSFFDDQEVPDQVREQIYEKISKIPKIKEVIVESRVEYINHEKLAKMRDSMRDKHVEIGIGLESANDHIRQNFINKGLTLDDFKIALKACKDNNIGVKAYLLLKPPFVNEQGAIDDCVSSIRTCINLAVDTISINPLNIQKGSLAEYLWRQNRYRPPWFYSLIKCLKNAINQEDLNETRVLSDPSGAGSKRGIHNCLKRECNQSMMNILRNFVQKQQVNELNQNNYKCNCKLRYQYQIKSMNSI
jgi:radical SAM enzyme (TIGR01210 family)